MPRAERMKSFVFEPARFRHDPAVLAMGPTARGAYVMLFCAGWDMTEQGVFPDDDRVLAQLAMVTPQEWTSVRAEVATAFDTTSRTGFWVQKGMARTAAAQNRWMKERSRVGRRAANTRWDKEKDASRIAGASADACGTHAIGGDGIGRDGIGVALPSVAKEGNGGAVFDAAAVPAPTLRAFGPALLRELEAKHPKRDVLSIAAKVLEHDPPYRQVKSALRNWCSIADEKDLDRKPWDPASWAQEDRRAAT